MPTHQSQLFERSSLLDVRQSLLQTLQLLLNQTLGLLGTLHSANFICLDSLDLLAHIVRRWLETLCERFNLVDNSLVLKNGSVVSEIDGLGSSGKRLNSSASIIVALLKGLELCSG